ncbi:hypothetical protein EW146_g6868 [Bondarzewia mesenterica]|uniref:BRCT domain-containing protein n=1 Tax=Bondarzewia mesenterica TaxID=1095465 RepID=A0A4S4LMB6_9AGAM|nr:hypothetical protein EW146_g6868 [Bondarzewia mesenterica]
MFFKGIAAVFDDRVDPQCLEDFVRLGGSVVRNNKGDIFICSSMRDTDFISKWYNGTPRVIVSRYIFDCMEMQCRLPIDTYCVGVDAKGYVVPGSSLMHIPPTKCLPAVPFGANSFRKLISSKSLPRLRKTELPTPPTSRTSSREVSKDETNGTSRLSGGKAKRVSEEHNKGSSFKKHRIQ